MISLAYTYLWSNKVISLVAIYMLLSVLLAAAFNINIGIPCLWKTLFKFNCPGCGLTTATIKLVRADLYGAYQANPLVFLVLPVGVFCVLRDFLKFKEKISLLKNS